MRRGSLPTTLGALLLIGLFAAWGCDGGGPIGSVVINDVPLKLAPPDITAGCDLADKPDDIGCGLICKPCVKFICVHGEWVKDEVGWPPELCEPGPDTDPPVGCLASPEGFCPAECHMCVPVSE